MALADAKGAIELAWEEGHEKGHKEGRKEEKKIIAIKMLEQGIDLDIINNVTGFPLDEIQNLTFAK